MVVCNDEKTIEEIQDIVRSWSIDNIVISPGPGSPECPKDIGKSPYSVLSVSLVFIAFCFGTCLFKAYLQC